MNKQFQIILLIFCSLFFLKAKSQTGTWTGLTSGTANSLLDVSIINNNISFISGGLGKILKTIDGGATWDSLASGTTEDLYSICFTDANNGFAVGNNGAIRRTMDGGTTWSGISFAIDSSDRWRCIYFCDANTGFISGGSDVSYASLYKTTDGGSNWTQIFIDSSYTIYDIKFTSPTIGYACDFNGAIFKTTNAGNTWTFFKSGVSTHLNSIGLTSDTSLFVTGSNGVIRKTINSGVLWSEVISGTGTSDIFSSIKFFDANNGFIVGGNVTSNTGTILNTIDGGSTWSQYTPGTSRLVRVDFLNSNLGYAVGLDGTILKYSAAIDNFSKVNNDIIVYPNPSNGSFTIDFSNEGTKNIRIYDLMGKLILSKDQISEKTLTIHLERKAKAIYILHIISNDKLFSKKIIIN